MGDEDNEKADDGQNQINASLGSLSLCVTGPSEEWVEETFETELERLLDEAEDVSKAVRDGERSIA